MFTEVFEWAVGTSVTFPILSFKVTALHLQSRCQETATAPPAAFHACSEEWNRRQRECLPQWRLRLEPGTKRRTIVGTGELGVDDWLWAVAEWREVKRST